MKILLVSIILLISQLAFGQEIPCKRSYPQNKGGGCKERYTEDANGNRQGKYISYDTEGNVVARGNYISGKKTGCWLDEVPYSQLNNVSDEQKKQLELVAVFGRTMPNFTGFVWYENGIIIANSETEIPTLAEAKRIQLKQKEELLNDIKEKEEKKRAEETENRIAQENATKNATKRNIENRCGYCKSYKYSKIEDSPCLQLKQIDPKNPLLDKKFGINNSNYFNPLYIAIINKKYDEANDLFINKSISDNYEQDIFIIREGNEYIKNSYNSIYGDVKFWVNIEKTKNKSLARLTFTKDYLARNAMDNYSHFKRNHQNDKNTVEYRDLEANNASEEGSSDESDEEEEVVTEKLESEDIRIATLWDTGILYSLLRFLVDKDYTKCIKNLTFYGTPVCKDKNHTERFIYYIGDEEYYHDLNFKEYIKKSYKTYVQNKFEIDISKDDLNKILDNFN